ncbi:MAG TPA: ribose 5-phosphate isomerase B [Oligoflexia bacterium]|nr:ribose 5-phosphate isomerase B [Oligoflexia bacterium]HMR25820.1 ribose 5-phosphate isomerase B [Oligoflexia bacterium]
MKVESKKVFIGGDHAALELKADLIDYLKQDLHYASEQIMDMGTNSEASVDYPDYAQKVCQAVVKSPEHVGVLICGTGIGISIAANKYKGIRAALVQSEFEAQMSRQHNDANVICFGARIIDQETAKKLLNIFLTTDFEGGRHQRRVDKIHSLSGC